MTSKRIFAVVIFLIGSAIGASTGGDLWDGSPFWVWLLVLISAIAVCGIAMRMWSAEKPQDRQAVVKNVLNSSDSSHPSPSNRPDGNSFACASAIEQSDASSGHVQVADRKSVFRQGEPITVVCMNCAYDPTEVVIRNESGNIVSRGKIEDGGGDTNWFTWANWRTTGRFVADWYVNGESHSQSVFTVLP